MFAATGINSLGEIVGIAFDSSTGACCHAFLAIPDNREVAGSANAALSDPRACLKIPHAPLRSDAKITALLSAVHADG
jgi:hypothetical protein